MATINQVLKRKKYVDVKNKRKALDKCPFKKGVCIKVFRISPKKPNSGNRSVVRVLLSNNKTVLANIGGQLHTLTKHSVVLIRGGALPDLPSCRYKVVRGKYDSTSVLLRKTSRSKYGVKKLF